MDNYVKNIPIDSIIPIEFHNDQDIDDLAKSIAKYGIVEPIIVRPKDGKYEIIAGKKRYHAAKMVGLQEVPILIRNINDEIIKDYHQEDILKEGIKSEKLSQNNQVPKKQNNKPPKPEYYNNNDIVIPNTFNKYENNNNQDIINLSELSINKEYKKEFERDELEMNNNELNNQEIQTPNISNEVSEPTFGGRFFPSLEDEPTNMNMGDIGIIDEPLQNSTPIPTPSESPMINLPNNNMDMNENLNIQTPEPIQPSNIENYGQVMEDVVPLNPYQATMTPQQNLNQEPEINNINQMPEMNYNQDLNMNPLPTMPMNNNQNMVDMISPQPQQIEPQTNQMPQLDMPQNVVPTQESNQMPQFDMTQSVAPTPINAEEPMIPMNQSVQQEAPVTQIINEYNQMPEIQNQNNFESPVIQQPVSTETPEIQASQILNEYNQIPGIPTPNNFDNNVMQQPASSVMPEIEVQEMPTQPVLPEQPMNMETVQEFPQKDISPVLNTIKALTNSLKEFGYDITISEEDLGQSTKISIEVLK